MPMHTDFAKPEVRRFIARTRSRMTLRRFKARINIIWITFDLWYSHLLVDTWRADLSHELHKQADLKRALAAAYKDAA
tara:strand:+ start:41071 stop:41304 length:234 start_codon:yes stop_codon:yes gene_type:complete